MNKPPVEPDLATRREAALARLLARINYERTPTVPYSKRELKLARMRDLLARLGHPEHHFPIVHVAGTKGKGSTATLLASMLTAAGRRTGLFTSPHLESLEERLAVDGAPCTPTELVELLERVWPAVEAIDGAAARRNPPAKGPTYFEITTALALCHFAARQVDAAVLEVGLGGRLDSTNVCPPLLSLITSISYDHTRQLGNTLAAIAREKAGIIKPGVPVVSGVTQPEPRAVIEEIASQRGAPLVQLGRDFDFRYRAPTRDKSAGLDFRFHVPGRQLRLEGLELGLLGRHQAANGAVALAAICELRHRGWQLPSGALRAGLAAARIPARVEVVARRPTVVIDGAHNGASIEALLETLAGSFRPARRVLLFATTREKDARGMLARLLPRFERVLLTRYRSNPRGVPPAELAALARELGGPACELHDEPEAAWERARELTGPDDLICVTGSFFIAAEIRPLAMQPASPVVAGG